MTIDEARASIGKPVDYLNDCWDDPERGTITSVSNWHVFVQFDGQQASKACRPEDLTLAAVVASAE